MICIHYTGLWNRLPFTIETIIISTEYRHINLFSKVPGQYFIAETVLYYISSS